MMTDGKHEGIPTGEGDDALWRLLARAPQPRPVSPYFARRVLREVTLHAEMQTAAGGMSHWLARTWQAWRHYPVRAVSGSLAVVMLLAAGVAGLSVLRPHPLAATVADSRPAPAAPVIVEAEDPVPTDATPALDPAVQGAVAFSSEPVVTAQDVEVIADLDNLLSREESRLWTEDDTARF